MTVTTQSIVMRTCRSTTMMCRNMDGSGILTSILDLALGVTSFPLVQGIVD